MGQMTGNEALALRWAELCADPRWQDLDAKIELNGYGVIELSPANNRYGMRQMAIGYALMQQLPAGTTTTGCSVFTSDGVRVPDVAWASQAFMAQHGEESPFTRAPEICGEVRSPSNTDAEMAHKTRLLLQAGAQEMWIVSEDGHWRVFDAVGEQPATRFAVVLQPPAA